MLNLWRRELLLEGEERYFSRLRMAGLRKYQYRFHRKYSLPNNHAKLPTSSIKLPPPKHLKCIINRPSPKPYSPLNTFPNIINQNLPPPKKNVIVHQHLLLKELFLSQNYQIKKSIFINSKNISLQKRKIKNGRIILVLLRLLRGIVLNNNIIEIIIAINKYISITS